VNKATLAATEASIFHGHATQKCLSPDALSILISQSDSRWLVSLELNAPMQGEKQQSKKNRTVHELESS